MDPRPPGVIKLEWKGGSQAVLGQLGADGTSVSDIYADDHDVSIASGIAVRTSTGGTLDLKIAGVIQPPPGRSPFGTVTISSATFDRHYQQPRNLFASVRTRSGVTDASTAALTASLRSFPNAEVVTREHTARTGEGSSSPPVAKVPERVTPQPVPSGCRQM